MSILINKQRGFVFTNVARLAIVSFIVSLAFALIATIWAVYLDSFVNNMAIVGFISAFLTLVSILFYFILVPLIEKSSKAKIYSYSLLFFSITYALFVINTKFYFLIILAFVLTILQTIRTTSFGIMVRDKSSKKNLSRNEGLTYSFMNLAWVIGPLIAGLLSEKYGINMIFILSAIFIFIAFLMFKFLRIKDNNIKKKAHSEIFKNFKAFFKSKDRILSYVLSGGVDLWWTLTYLFIPLLIIREGLGIKWVGYFLFAVAVPLIMFQYIFSKLAGKVGFRKIFKIGFSIPFLFALLCFFIGNIYLIMLFLVLASIGLAMLEPTTEAYFFDLLKKDEECRFYGPYNTTVGLNQLIGKIIPSILLIFFPFKFIFLFFSFYMFIMFVISFKIRNIIESKRDGKRKK